MPHSYEQTNPLHVTGPTQPEDPNAYAAVDYSAVGGGGGDGVYSYSDGTIVEGVTATGGLAAQPGVFVSNSAPLARKVSTYEGFGPAQDSAV